MVIDISDSLMNIGNKVDKAIKVINSFHIFYDNASTLYIHNT